MYTSYGYTPDSQFFNETDFCKDIGGAALTKRAWNCLDRAEIGNIQGLSEITEYELLKIKNMGRKTHKEILTAMSKAGITFKCAS